MRTAFTDLVNVDQPLVGFNRSPGVVAAVSRACGLGVFAATAYSPEQFDAQLTWIEENCDGREILQECQSNQTLRISNVTAYQNITESSPVLCLISAMIGTLPPSRR